MWPELKSVAELSSGYPFRSAVRPEPGGDIAVVQLYDLASPDISLSESVARVSNFEGKYQRYLLRVGDVLFQARGSVHRAAVVLLNTPAISSPGLHVLRPRTNLILSDYLAWCVNHPRIQAAIATVAQGTHAPFVSKQSLGALQIPMPPLAVQHRIAEVSRLRDRERQLAARLSEAQDSLVDGATWQAAAAAAQ
jgi:hypothetical protein